MRFPAPRRPPLLAALALASPFLLASLAACTNPFHDAGPPLRIGVVGPMTGPLTAMGGAMRDGVGDAMNDINRRGGVRRRALTMRAADDRCEAPRAAVVARGLVEEKIKFVIGHFCSVASEEAAPIYADAGVLEITPASGAPAVTDEPAAKGKSTAFRLVPRSDTQGPALAAYVTAHYAGRPLAIVQDGSPYGRMVADSARAALAAAGIVPAAEATVPGSIPDFAGTVAELKSRAIGVVIYGGYARAAGALAAEARKQGLDLALGGGDALGAPELWSAAGAAGDGVFMTALPDPRELGAARVVESGLAHFGVNTSGYTIRAYAAMQVIAQAAEQAKSLDPAEVAKAMHAGSFETAMGTVAFDAKGDLAEQRWSIRVWRDGRIVAP